MYVLTIRAEFPQRTADLVQPNFDSASYFAPQIALVHVVIGRRTVPTVQMLFVQRVDESTVAVSTGRVFVTQLRS